MSVQGTQSYGKYYRTFLGNRDRGHRFQLVLLTEVICGIPSAAAEATDGGHFDVALDTGAVRQISWQRLLLACPIG